MNEFHRNYETNLRQLKQPNNWEHALEAKF
jgi:hypothetical protein